MGLHRRAVRRKGRPLSSDPFDLKRFIKPQEAIWKHVQTELAAGRKQSHWIWFVFPQVAGLGSSLRSVHFAITVRGEALAYLAHDILGRHLIEATGLVLAVEGCSAHDIFGSPDDLKFRSSMTLFDAVAPNDIFAEALERYFDGEGDPLTLEKLN